ncbi:MAG: ABC transporter permease, partial [Acidimicrobiia bacterium]|nr:ABC transporter permease [Acidimicrobiia bacterium]
GYATFVAPALMASSAMNGAIFESTMNIYHKLKYQRLYDSVLATPMTVPDVALGEIGFSMMRGVLYSTAFVFTMWALGMVGSWWMVLSVPACALIGFAFSAIGMTATTFIRSWADFEYVPSVQIPLFLFSATFYPLSSYGDWGWVVQLSPLYHGVAIVRALNVGDVGPMMLVHGGVLFVIGVAGVAVASRRIRTLLLP